MSCHIRKMKKKKIKTRGSFEVVDTNEFSVFRENVNDNETFNHFNINARRTLTQLDL